ncbi:tripartite motif-containing protein 60-like [Mastomys coucha]|uniref:tripartite motif-containing protein 60-like n=1 Tax=Mastomys coucha TaxID=35658 RepID=UPI001261A90A|nr:tripartite motif-containing protein 60-like [Mastomys coucha]
MDSTALKNLQDNCTCLICSDFMEDPVTNGCGHNFCHACLCLLWNDLKDTFCPVCQTHLPQRSLSRNHQFRNMIEIIRLLPKRQRKRKRQEEHTVCQKHDQPLVLFCVKDRDVLCTKCSLSVEHQGHYTCSIKKAGSYHQKVLKMSIESVKWGVKEAEEKLALQHRRVLGLRKKTEYQKKKISYEFAQIKLFLQTEYEACLNEININELVSFSELNGYLETLSDHVSTAKDLLKEVEGIHEASDVILLTSTLTAYHRLQNLKYPKPWSFRTEQYGLSLPPQYSGLNRIIKKFQTDVTFDRNTAHPQLVISEDRKSVFYKEARQCVGASPQSFHPWPALLGCKGFYSGRQYWEVKVGDKPRWALGVCQARFSGDWSNWPSGFWAIGRHTENGYVTYGPMRTEFLPVVQPSKIGIFLDYELGELSFYNMNDRSLLYTFRNSFPGTLWPYFYTGTDSEALEILTHPTPDTGSYQVLGQFSQHI